MKHCLGTFESYIPAQYFSEECKLQWDSPFCISNRVQNYPLSVLNFDLFIECLTILSMCSGLFISHAILRQTHITSVSKIILKNWSRHTLKVRNWDDMCASRYGFWRTYVVTVIYKYLDCGDLHKGFARVRCEECVHEYLPAIFHPRKI